MSAEPGKHRIGFMREQPLPAILAVLLTVAMFGSAVVLAQVPDGAARAPERVVLTLDDALAVAEARSEQVAIAAAGVDRARGGERLARSERFPQLYGAASYDRSLASEFEGLFDSADSGASCDPLQANPDAPLADRVAELERAYGCEPSSGFFGDDVELPFGRKDTYRLNLVLTQALYAGGRIAAQERQARLARENASLALSSARAQLALDVTRAFLDAALGDRLVAIAQAAYEQADRALDQTRAQRQAGRLSEFELLRAQVDRDTLQPEVIRRRASRELAYLQLKQLLELPSSMDVQLAAVLESDVAPAERFGAAIAEVEGGVVSRERSGVTQAEQAVTINEAGVRIARAERLPSVSLVSSYGLVNYSGVPAFDDFRTNWTLGALVQVPLLTGGRLAANEAIARADVEEARQRVKLARELADLDVESARQELASARAAFDATAGTIRQAARAYEIAELRYREGLSTQLELSDARLLLQQAEANRAVAGRDLQLARVRLALLPDLPLTTTGAAGGAAAGQRLVTALSASGATGAAGGGTPTSIAGVQQR